MSVVVVIHDPESIRKIVVRLETKGRRPPPEGKQRAAGAYNFCYQQA
jgi:hypothetical protein